MGHDLKGFESLRSDEIWSWIYFIGRSHTNLEHPFQKCSGVFCEVSQMLNSNLESSAKTKTTEKAN